MSLERPDAAVPTPRPRALVLGEPPLRGGDVELRRFLDCRAASVEELLTALGGDPPEVVLLDGRLPADALGRVLRRVGPPGATLRPAVVVVTEEGRTQLEAGLVDHADDFVSGSLGEQVLLARVGTALRLRACLEELSRKNAELEALSARFEGLTRRMAEELRLASQVQRTLLPPPLSHPRLDLAAEFIPLREIGGDYYDFIPLEDGRLALAIGDVMGKGIPAALMAANLKACLRAHIPATSACPAETIGRVNRLFGDVSPRSLFASLFFGIFDFAAGRFDYVNAGHESPLLIRPDGRLEQLGEGGPVLGLIEQAAYRPGEVSIDSGDTLVFYSDGLTDRGRASGELFGAERLREAAVRSRADAARIALYSLLGEVQGWSGGQPAEDDLTLIVARVR